MQRQLRLYRSLAGLVQSAVMVVQSIVKKLKKVGQLISYSLEDQLVTRHFELSSLAKFSAQGFGLEKALIWEGLQRLTNCYRYTLRLQQRL